MTDTLSPEVGAYIENLNKQLEQEKLRRMTIENQIGQSSLSSSAVDKNQNVIELQLDVDKMLDKTYHLLSGHEVKVNKETNQEYWGEPEDDRLKTFSIYGVKQIMNLLGMYVNINTLMAFYDLDTIRWKVRDFGIELSDLFLNRYEVMLYYPSPEEIYEKYRPVLAKKNFDINEQELYAKCVQWSEEELAARENLLPIICYAIVDMVHSAYMRALQGQERKSLGERGININQSTSGEQLGIMPQKKPGLFGRLTG